MKKLLKTQEVSALTGIPASTLDNWRSREVEIPFIRAGRSVYYERSDVEEWLASSKVHIEEPELPFHEDAVDEERVALEAHIIRLQEQAKADLVTINTKLPRSSRDHLRSIARKDGVTIQSLIQEAVEQYLTNLD